MVGLKRLAGTFYKVPCVLKIIKARKESILEISHSSCFFKTKVVICLGVGGHYVLLNKQGKHHRVYVTHWIVSYLHLLSEKKQNCGANYFNLGECFHLEWYRLHSTAR